MVFSKQLKRLAFMPLKTAINRIDFVKIIEMLNRSEAGRAWAERLGPPKSAFPDEKDIIARTVELTEADLAEQGQKTSREDIETWAKKISCRYDYDLHDKTKNALSMVLDHLFIHEDTSRIFLSEDRRELAHFERVRQARRDGMGVVYLVNHSTHFDEFVVDIVLNQLGVELPLFAAGANMMATPSIERVLMVGSYVIVRKDASKAYLAALFNYCRALGEMGKQQVIFLEAWSGGARTRDGSLRYPRRLVTLQGALASARDILVQPVVISYSAVPEDLSLSERAGSLSWINGLSYFRNWVRSPHRPFKALGRALNGVYGRSFITFCRPRLLSELKRMRAEDPADLPLDEFTALDSMREIARDKKIMASHLTARGLVRAKRDGTTDLEAATRAELEALVEYHQRTFGQEPDLEDFIRRNSLADVIEDGLRTLDRRKIIAKKRRRLPETLAEHGLQYYATHADRRLYSPSAKENIVVVGGGALGYALTCLIGNRTLDDKRYQNSSVTLFDSREDLVASMVDTRFHPVHFPKVRLPRNVFIASDATAAFRKGTEVLVTVPVDFFEDEVRRLLTEAQQPLSIIIATRGFEQSTNRLPIQIAQALVQETGHKGVSLLVLSGPVTPQILAEGQDGAMVLAGPQDVAQTLADRFRLPRFQVHVCGDPVGVQVAGTMAQVYSCLGAYLMRSKAIRGREQIAAFYGETSAEALKLAVALGGREETFMATNPAWAAEYVSAGLGGPGAKFGRKAAGSLIWAKRSARDLTLDSPEDLQEEGYRIIGYTGIRSAYLTAKDLNLTLPRLEEAYNIFWAD